MPKWTKVIWAAFDLSQLMLLPGWERNSYKLLCCNNIWLL